MGLRNITIRREAVTLPDGQSFQVRGLTAFDIFDAIGAYGPQMSMLFAAVTSRQQKGGALSNADVKNAILAAIKEFPDLIAHAAASAADDVSPEAITAFKQLPMPTQAETIETIFSLTFASEGEVKKLIESLSRMMLVASTALKAATSQVGIGVSADK